MAGYIGGVSAQSTLNEAIRKQTTLEEMANRVSGMNGRIQSIISNLDSNADRLFGGCPECREEACLDDRPSGSISELDRTLRGLAAQIDILADTAARFNGI